MYLFIIAFIIDGPLRLTASVTYMYPCLKTGPQQRRYDTQAALAAIEMRRLEYSAS